MRRRLPGVRLSVVIQHSPRRSRDWVYAQLKKDLDPQTPFSVVTDERDALPNENRTFLTYRRCLEKTPFTATHRLVLQDDVKLCRNFIPAVKQAITAEPDRLIAFFLGNKPGSSAVSYFQACEEGKHWAELDNRTWQPAQALCWPAFLIDPMLRFADVNYRENKPDDELIGEFMRTTGQKALVTIPSLVQHAHHTGSSSVGSLGGAYRQAACFIGEWDPVAHIKW